MATAIICECSPFHNGHQYLFRTARLLTGEENIAIMSGSFTQRGEVAVTDKFTRAGALIRGGADLVLELPAAFAVANAQRFAEGGVRIAKSFACVNTLAFGCETEDIGVLRTAANALRSERVNSLIAEEMQAGGYYPRALQSAVEKVYGADAAAAVSSPNNILAVEYIRALEGSGIAPRRSSGRAFPMTAVHRAAILPPLLRYARCCATVRMYRGSSPRRRKKSLIPNGSTRRCFTACGR